MYRYSLAAGLALAVFAGAASADYVIIRVDLNKVSIGKAPDQGKQNMGMPPKGFAGGPPGGFAGGPPGGPPGGFAGGPPGGNAGGPPGGFAGGPPGGNPAVPPGGNAGMPLPPGGFGGMFPGKGGEEVKETPPLYVHAYLELKGPAKQMGGTHALVEHRFGKVIVPAQNIIKYVQQGDVAKRFADKRRKLAKPRASDLVDMAQWALEHGLVGDFVKTMKEAEAADPAHPSVVAFLKVHEQLAKEPTELDPSAAGLAEDLKNNEYRLVVSDQKHYALLTRLAPDDGAVKSRLQRLEETYHTVFYWFAIKGKALPVPRHRLVVVLEKDARDYRARHALFTPSPSVGDGFTARRDNALILSAKPLDPAYEQLEKNNQNYWLNLKVTRTEVLGEEIYKKRLQLNPADVPVLQTLALVQRAMEDESERATTTHEAVRQLLAATNLLPRNVATAEWVRSGIASFFETPHRSFHPSPGSPSMTNLVAFKYLRKKGKLSDARAKEAVLATITDEYFHRARTLQARLADNRSDEALRKEAEEAAERARATAWALTYYLMNHKLEQLHAYLQEVSALPREADFDAAVLRGCFARAFNMTGASLGQIDATKLDRLASDCFSAMESTVLEIEGIEQFALEARAQAAAPPRPRPSPPNQPGQPPPGGFPPAGFPTPSPAPRQN
jgi:hypothetical protein